MKKNLWKVLAANARQQDSSYFVYGFYSPFFRLCTMSNSSHSDLHLSPDLESAVQEHLEHVKSIISKGPALHDTMHEICSYLHAQISHFDWVGFYLDDPEKKGYLKLGPYIGAPTDHTSIPYGKGICGQVAVSLETFISQDVHAEDNYIACSLEVQSEIVVPILKEGRFMAQIDIDSNTRSGITPADQKLLEGICALLSPLF